MSKLSVGEDEIVDVIKGDADEETKRRVLEATSRDPRAKEVFDQWKKILSALEPERKRQRGMARRTKDAVMRAIQQGTPVPLERPRLFFGLKPIWGIAAAATFIVGGAGLYTLGPRLSGELTAKGLRTSSAINQTMIAEAPNLEKSANDLYKLLDSAPKGMAVRLPAGDFGGSLRVTKPMILVAESGPVTIGRH